MKIKNFKIENFRNIRLAECIAPPSVACGKDERCLLPIVKLAQGQTQPGDSALRWLGPSSSARETAASLIRLLVSC